MSSPGQPQGGQGTNHTCQFSLPRLLCFSILRALPLTLHYRQYKHSFIYFFHVLAASKMDHIFALTLYFYHFTTLF